MRHVSRLGALLVAAVPLFTACRQAGPGPGGAERFVVSDDGAAVLWIPEGATSADDITVTRVASDTMVVYELLPDGLKLAVPAVLFVRAPGAVPAEDGEGPARVAMLAGDVVSSDGSVEAVQTVRGAITGSEGPQHGLIALVVPHFTKARMQIPSVIVEGSLHDNGASHFRRTVGETWDASVVLTFPVVGSAARPPSIDYTVQTSGSVALTDATAAGPRPFPIGPGVVPSASLRLKCNSAGPGFVRVVVTSGSSSMVLHLAGICAAPEFAAALEGTADVFLSSDEAVAALVEDVMGPLPAPKPTAPVQPVRELAWGNPGPPTHTQELTLSCTECPLNVPQMGRYRVTATSAAKPEQLHLRVSGGGVVSIAKPSAQWSALPTGQTADLAFTYTCTAAGTGRIEPRLTHTPPLPAPVDPHAFVALSGPVSVSPYKGADGNSFALITCGSPGKDVRVGLSDRVPIGRFSTGNWELDAAAAFADVCDPNTPPYPLTGDTVAIKVTKCGYVTRTRTVVLKSNRQNVTGTWDPNQNVYDFGGAAPGPAYDPTDSLQASFVLEDGGTPVTNVSAPAGITNPNLFFSAPSGWGTRVRFADGYANTLQTRALFTSTTGPAGATYEVTRLTPASALPLVGSFRETPLFAPEVTQQLAATGWTLTTVDVQLANSVNAAWVTPPEQPVAVRAGRTFRFDVTSLFADAGTGGGAGGGAGGGGGGGGTSGTGGGGGSGGSGGAGGGSSTFVQLTPAAGPASAELAARLGENHAGFVQQRLTGSAQVVSGNVLLYDNPTGGASRIVGVLATFAAGTAVGAFSNSNQPVNMTTGGPYVKGGERWAMVTRVNAGRRLTLDRLSGTGPLTATAIEVVVLGDYNPEYTVTETAPMTLFENYGPITTYFSTLVMTMSPGGGEPAMRWKICPDGLPCAMPGEVRRITLPATMGNPVPVNNTFVTWPHDIAGNVSPLTATFSIYIEVPPTGPYRIIWNRL